MSTQTLNHSTAAATAAPARPRALKPGIYRGGSAAEFGLWRLTDRGIWLFAMPVEGYRWKRAGDQNPGDSLILLVDETRI
jgi:hypothetical protein